MTKERYGCYGNRQDNDLVLYSDNNYYICYRDNEVRYFYIADLEEDRGEITTAYGELCKDVVPVGFLQIIRRLILNIIDSECDSCGAGFGCEACRNIDIQKVLEDEI